MSRVADHIRKDLSAHARERCLSIIIETASLVADPADKLDIALDVLCAVAGAAAAIEIVKEGADPNAIRPDQRRARSIGILRDVIDGLGEPNYPQCAGGHA